MKDKKNKERHSTDFQSNYWLSTCLEHCEDYGISKLAISLFILHLNRNEQKD